MALSPSVAEWLRSEGHEAAHAAELGFNRSEDTEILAFAAADGRVILTADLDFPRLLANLGAAGPGLILLRGGNYSEKESLACVRRVLLAIPEEELKRAIVVVDKEKIRRRWLPL
jgi:predicted nuclease of predicted toxin-antitoxin system